MRPGSALALIACGVLAACASAPVGEAPMTWGFSTDGGEGPKLVFGVDESDDVALVLLCPSAGGRIEMIVPIADRSRVTTLGLRSGRIQRRYEEEEPSGEPDGMDLARFSTAPTDPVLTAFAVTGRLAVDVYGGFVSHDAPRPAERAAVAAFASACGLRR